MRAIYQHSRDDLRILARLLGWAFSGDAEKTAQLRWLMVRGKALTSAEFDAKLAAGRAAWAATVGDVGDKFNVAFAAFGWPPRVEH